MYTIRKANKADIENIRNVAIKTWPDAYGEILSKEQLSYMLELMYSPSALEESMKKQEFAVAEKEGSCVGFCAVEHFEEGRTHLHKLYVLPQTQGTGLGKLLLDYIEKSAVNAGSDHLTLNVNRFNKARNFYEKIGFEVFEEVDVEIGNGYLMEDYRMRKRL